MASAWNRGRWIVAVSVAASAFAGCKSTRSSENEIPEAPPSGTMTSGAKGANGSNGGADAWRESSASAPFVANAGVANEVPNLESANPGSTVRVHVVKKGDTLFSLARQYYDGDQSQWRKIYAANRDKIPNKDAIKIGQTIVIPD